MKYKIGKIVVFSLTICLLTAQAVYGATADRLAGRVLLQVESRGEAWYVNPVNLKRYFLGRAADTAKVIRSLGMPVTNDGFNGWRGVAPARLSGRLLIKTEDNNLVYYVNPVNLKIIYLGRPEVAFDLWKKYAIGVSNKTLAQITPEFNLANPVGSQADTSTTLTDVRTGRTTFFWHYKNKAYSLSLTLSRKLYDSYRTSQKTYQYYGDLPANWHNDYYKMFLTPKATDTTAKDLAAQFRYIAGKEGLSDDDMVSLVLAFVQTIPYDSSKNLATGQPNYPYETLFTNLGVCSDKTFLTVLILRQLGYGAAIIDLPDVNHEAVGIACPMRYSVFGSGYCYAETTNFFPIGFVPQSLGNRGVVANLTSDSFKGQFNNVFNPARLGKPEILQKTVGKEYRSIEATFNKVQTLLQLEKDLAEAAPALESIKADLGRQLDKVDSLQAQMNQAKAKGDVAKYNSLVDNFNSEAQTYKNIYGDYKMQSDIYNQKIDQYNSLVENFYPSK